MTAVKKRIWSLWSCHPHENHRVCINLNLTFAFMVGSLNSSASKGQSFLSTSLVTECSCVTTQLCHITRLIHCVTYGSTNCSLQHFKHFPIPHSYPPFFYYLGSARPVNSTYQGTFAVNSLTAPSQQWWVTCHPVLLHGRAFYQVFVPPEVYSLLLPFHTRKNVRHFYCC